MNLYKLLQSKILWGIILFVTVFVVFAFNVKEIWFSLDDLGVIINGLIKKFSDFIRVFSEDERNYICPINFNVPPANLISGFYRPFQHIPFSIVYFLKDFDAYSFYLCNVFFHAINSLLFFYFSSFFMSLGLALLGGFLFAFYPPYEWIVWIATLHNFLAVFFMLLSLFFYRMFFKKNNYVAYFVAAFMFLLSLLSRENTIFLGIWLFIGVYLLADLDNQFFLSRIKYTFSKTYLFFLTYVIYFLLKLNAFGYKTLPRTLEHIFMKFGFLRKFFGSLNHDQISTVVNVPIASAANTSVANIQISQSSFLSSLIENLKSCLALIKANLYHFFNFYDDSTSGTFFLIALTAFFVFFLIYAYRHNLKVLVFLFSGVILFSWTSIIAYPNPRYMNAVYPFLIFMVLMGINFYKKDGLETFLKKIIFALMLVALGLAVFNGVRKNISGIKSGSAATLLYKEKFENFFKNNSFNQNVNFIVIGSPFVSDIQNVFQVFLNDLNLKLAHVRDSTLAEKGIMGCRGDYKSKGVESKIEAVNIDGKFGYRLISLDKEHCGWWMDFSFFPLKWSKENRAYIWTSKPPEIGVWHEFSMGKFLINERLENKCNTDVTFIFDNEWIDKNTIFVTWDTMQGEYKILGKAV